MSTTVRFSDNTHPRLTALAAATGRRMQTIVEDAVAGYEANEFWVTFAAGYDGLADDPAAWLQVQVQSERAGEETALNRQCRAELKPVARRGEVWLVDFGTPVGHEQGFQRPAVVVSDDRLNGSRAELVIVIPTITTRRGLPSHVAIETRDSGLAETSHAKAEDIKSVSTHRHIRRLGALPADRLNHAEQVLRPLLGL